MKHLIFLIIRSILLIVFVVVMLALCSCSSISLEDHMSIRAGERRSDEETIRQHEVMIEKLLAEREYLYHVIMQLQKVLEEELTEI